MIECNAAKKNCIIGLAVNNVATTIVTDDNNPAKQASTRCFEDDVPQRCERKKKKKNY